MKISKAHQRFADYLNGQRAIEHPEEFLGENWKDVLNFWLYLDTLSDDQLESVGVRYWGLNTYVREAARDAAWDVARGATEAAAGWDVAWYAAGDAADWATYELIGSHFLLSQINSLTFFPLFLNL